MNHLKGRLDGKAATNTKWESGESNHSLSVTPCNNSYNVMLAGARIASFLSYDKAMQFAGEGWHE